MFTVVVVQGETWNLAKRWRVVFVLIKVNTVHRRCICLCIMCNSNLSLYIIGSNSCCMLL